MECPRCGKEMQTILVGHKLHNVVPVGYDSSTVEMSDVCESCGVHIQTTKTTTYLSAEEMERRAAI